MEDTHASLLKKRMCIRGALDSKLRMRSSYRVHNICNSESMTTCGGFLYIRYENKLWVLFIYGREVLGQANEPEILSRNSYYYKTVGRLFTTSRDRGDSRCFPFYYPSASDLLPGNSGETERFGIRDVSPFLLYGDKTGGTCCVGRFVL